MPHFTPGAADQFHGLLPPATRLPTTPALTSGCCFLPNFTLLRRPWTLGRGSSTTAASYRHTSVAQALPGRCVVAALHPSPSSPTCGNLRHTWCFCFGVNFCFQAAQLSDGQVKGNSIGRTSPNRGALAPQGQHATSRVKDALRTKGWLIPPHGRQQLS